MTTQEILDYNRRCAEFLGIVDNNNYLKFDSDWNRIMEVVEKIQSLNKLGGIVMIQQGRCQITSRMVGDNSIYADVSLYFEKGIKGQKEAVVKAIDEFLIWYNENKEE